MLDVILAPQSLPFVAAIGVVLMLALLELLGLVLGHSLAHTFDHWIGAKGVHAPESEGFIASSLEWLSVGRVPVVVVIITFLTAFGVAGLVIERIAYAATGYLLPTILASAGAFLLALPMTRGMAAGLARILPRDETEAVSLDTFVGRVATLTVGSARRGIPAEAKLTDSYGRTHYVRVEPDNDAEVFSQGTRVLVVSRHGAVFRVIEVPDSALRTA